MNIGVAEFIIIKNKSIYRGIKVKNLNIGYPILSADLVRKNIEEDTMYSINEKKCVRLPLRLFGTPNIHKIQILEFMDMFLSTNKEIMEILKIKGYV